MERKWKLKDGTIRTKKYETIGGEDALEYRRRKDAMYRARRQGTVTPPKPRAKTCKYDLVDDETVKQIKALRKMGLSFIKIGKAFNMSKHCAQNIWYLR